MKSANARVAVITGAAGGLGSALTRELAKRGWNLALVDIDSEKLAELVGTLASSNNYITAHVADLRNSDQIAALTQEVKGKHGSVHCLINNAGITLQKSIESHSIEDWRRVFDLNFWATVSLCQVFLPILKEHSRANIVNISSMAACYGMPSQSSYSSSKAAVQAFSESLRVELSSYGIGVTCILPGAINTDMIKATLSESDDIAQAKKNLALAQRFGIPPEKAAKCIIDAFERNRRQKYVGIDARVFNWMVKLCPGLVSAVFANTYQSVNKVNPT
ncbi:SDR family oxidoreductase [Spongiibacter nanhainus]|uniref:SDR family oxidoreductase n=1 Tax=Spongiibacter nanhainus TaxID=2794344 RepID=A0A7T4UPU1_9GAMM|nr:SDR family oxidoreductase [Spongiibacter nanhainus]QQD17363.1 SDR family oxidoreductase [Spongiibacter nanhainus]